MNSHQNVRGASLRRGEISDPKNLIGSVPINESGDHAFTLFADVGACPEVSVTCSGHNLQLPNSIVAQRRK